VAFFLFNKFPAHANPALLYAPLPLLLFAAVRYGSMGATAANVVVAVLAVWGAAHGQGPFWHGSAIENAFYVQLFLIFVSASLLFLAALIEEKNTVEARLREREERIELAADAANLALWTIDFERGESWMSQKGREMFGFAADEPLSHDLFLSRLHPEDRHAVEDAIERTVRSPHHFEIECRLIRPDGETRSLITRGRYLRNDLDEGGELIAVAIDVTRQVKTNLELREQRDELVRLTRVALMGQLAASLAHELNQPLTAIASNAAAGKRFLAQGPLDPPFCDELLADIIPDARRACDVVHGIYH
jgi:PAS domain S-box-containing protein